MAPRWLDRALRGIQKGPKIAPKAFENNPKSSLKRAPRAPPNPRIQGPVQQYLSYIPHNGHPQGSNSPQEVPKKAPTRPQPHPEAGGLPSRGRGVVRLASPRRAEPRRRDIFLRTPPQETGNYDPFRHKYLREAFVTVYATGDGKAIDCHKHFIEEAGQTEHSEFVKNFLKPGYLDEGPLGPKSSRARPKSHPKPKPKASVATKNMLRPPRQPLPDELAPPGGDRPGQMFSDAPIPLPRVSSQAPAAADGAGAGDAGLRDLRGPDDRCLAQTRNGTRCTNAKKHGDTAMLPQIPADPGAEEPHGGPQLRGERSDNQLQRAAGGSPWGGSAYFCTQHAKQAKSEKSQRTTAAALAHSLRSAATNWAAASEKEQMEEAIRRSMGDQDGEFRKRQERSQAILAPRLLQEGLERLDTAPFGNCQFIAVARSSGTGVSHERLRQEVCDYLETLAPMFADFGDFPDYKLYVDGMRADGAWGDHLTLTAMSHLLNRPIDVITDSVSHNYIRRVEPHHSVAKSSWGPPVVVVHYGERHYETTRPASQASA